MRKKSFLTALLLVLALTMTTFMFVIAGCKGGDEDENKGNGGGDNTQTAGCYYLSVLDDGTWTSYSSDSSVPADKKFVADEDVYTLSVHLAEGDSVKIAQVNSQTTYGYDAIFSTNTQLTEGSGNAISVGETGTYKLTLDVSDTSISYKFTPDNPGSDEAEVVSVEITETEVNLTVNGTQKLHATATLSDETTTTEGITWVIGDTTVATVSEDGTVTAVKAGDTSIIAKCGDVESDPVLISVTEEGPEPGAVELEKTTLRLSVGATEKLNYTLTEPAQIVQWNSDTPTVATVDQEGNVEAVAAGTAIITLFYKPSAESNMTSVSCTVTVNTPVTAITLNNTELSVAEDSTATLTVGFTPANATNRNYTYEISDGAVATVAKSDNQLTVTPVAQGTATLTVTSEDGEYKATCEITVVPAGSVIVNISNSLLTLNKTGTNASATLSVSVTGDDNPTVSWSSSETGVATVDTNGAVTAVAYGTTVVTATVNAGGQNIEKTCTVRVAPDNFFLYGYGSWQNSDDEVDSGLLIANNNDGTFSLSRELTSNSTFRIGYIDNGDFFTQTGGNWVGYGYSSITSGSAVVTSGATNNIVVDVTGTYTITVSIAGNSPKITITRDAISVASISIAADNSTLSAGGSANSATISLTVNPSEATCTAADINWTCDSSNVTVVEASDKKSVTVTANDDAASGTVTITCNVKGKTATVKLTVIAAGQQETPVSSIAFAEDKYSFNVNGATAWTVNVAASVNSDATNRNVTYSTTDSGVIVDAATGEVTASKVGTYTITATAAGDTSKTATASVTFYSDYFYLSGSVTNWNGNYPASSTANSAFENYTFTQDSSIATKYTLDVVLSGGAKLVIVFCGCDTVGSWAIQVIKADTATVTGAVGSADNDGNIVVNGLKGLYTITLDISGATPQVTVTRTGDEPGFTATINGQTGTSSVTNNRYAITVSGVTLATASAPVIAISGSATSSYTYPETLEAGNYRFDVVCDAAGNVVSATAIKIESAGPVVSTDYVMQYSDADTEWTATDIDGASLYYDAATGEYTFYFSLEVTAWKNVGLIITDASGNKIFEVWSHSDLGLATVTDKSGNWLAKSISENWNNMQSGTTGTMYCAVTFTASGISSITCSSNDDLNTNS